MLKINYAKHIWLYSALKIHLVVMEIVISRKPDAVRSRLVAPHLGMSSIGISITQLAAHEDTSYQEIKNFQSEE
jgi:hypothetical protein